MDEQAKGGDVTDPARSIPHHIPVSSLALLIDADNTATELFPDIMKKTEIWGNITLRRAYGNQETLLGQKWKDLCLQYALQPMLHLGISGVKNATDIALAVDAMELFHTQSITTFCLVTGDQDFTPLVLRLRSYGCQVYCIGKPSKADALAKVCTAFLPVGHLVELGSIKEKTKAKAVLAEEKTKAKLKQPQPKKPTGSKSHMDAALTQLLMQAAADLMRDKNLEWVSIPQLGSRLHQLDAKFAAKTYGQKNLPALCKVRTDLFECRPKGSHLEVRLKM